RHPRSGALSRVIPEACEDPPGALTINDRTVVFRQGDGCVGPSPPRSCWRLVLELLRRRDFRPDAAPEEPTYAKVRLSLLSFQPADGSLVLALIGTYGLPFSTFDPLLQSPRGGIQLLLCELSRDGGIEGTRLAEVIDERRLDIDVRFGLGGFPNRFAGRFWFRHR